MNKISLFVFLLFTVYCLLPTNAFAHGDAHGELIIRMTDNGFEPKELTVTEGDEILFINNDDTDRWPASNFHPSHTLYPEFDPKMHVKPGESWKFIFEKTGTWRMHDHLIPHMTGTIVALEVSTTTNTETTTPETKPSLWAKFKNFLLKLFERKPAEEASYDDHAKAHLKGQLFFKEYGLDGVAYCTREAAFGCYHGLLEVAFAGQSEEKYRDNLLEAEGSCRKLGRETSGSFASCIHGIGHGTATYREHALAVALTDCDTLSQKIRTYCHDGVFMEFSISAPSSFYHKENPIYPCDVADESYKVACARSQVQVMRLRFGFDTNTIIETCEETGNQKIIYNCIDSLGYFIAKRASGEASKIITSCNEIKGEAAAAQCVAAAAGELVFQDTLGWQQSAPAVCQMLREPYQQKCLERVAQVKQSYGRD